MGDTPKPPPKRVFPDLAPQLLVGLLFLPLRHAEGLSSPGLMEDALPLASSPTVHFDKLGTGRPGRLGNQVWGTPPFLRLRSGQALTFPPVGGRNGLGWAGLGSNPGVRRPARRWRLSPGLHPRTWSPGLTSLPGVSSREAWWSGYGPPWPLWGVPGRCQSR